MTIGVSVVSLSSSDSKDSSSALMIHDFSDHFFPRSMHELGQMVDGAGEVARELTKRTIDHVASGALLGKRSASYEGINEDQQDAGAVLMNPSLGITAVLVAVAVSGLTGVYFEKVLKDSASPVSVWTRNIQLSFYSLFPALFVGILFKDGPDIAKHGFFDGYNWIVWTVIVFQSVGGILTSLCINYADNIAKNFATSFSFIISFMFSMLFFGFQMTTTVGPTLCLLNVYTSLVLTIAPSSPLAPSSCSYQPTCTLAQTASAAARHPLRLSTTRRRRSTAKGRLRPRFPTTAQKIIHSWTHWNRSAPWACRRRVRRLRSATITGCSQAEARPETNRARSG